MNHNYGEIPLEQPDDAAILDQIRNGQADSYGLLIQKYQSRLYPYCYRMLGNHHEAEEAVQEVFVKGYQYLHQFTRHISFSAWLYKIAYHHCLNVLKRRKYRFQAFRFLVAQQREPVPSGHDSSGPGTELLAKLSPEERNLVVLRALDGYSFDDIAQIVGCKATTARKRYERAKQKLKHDLSKGEMPYDHI